MHPVGFGCLSQSIAPLILQGAEGAKFYISPDGGVRARPPGMRVLRISRGVSEMKYTQVHTRTHTLGYASELLL